MTDNDAAEILQGVMGGVAAAAASSALDTMRRCAMDAAVVFLKDMREPTAEDLQKAAIRGVALAAFVEIEFQTYLACETKRKQDAKAKEATAATGNASMTLEEIERLHAESIESHKP